MRYPKRDRNFRDIIDKTAKQNERGSFEVERAVEAYFKIVAQLIQWDEPVTIHVDYIGDLKFNQKWVNKIKKIQDDNRNKI